MFVTGSMSTNIRLFHFYVFLRKCCSIEKYCPISESQCGFREGRSIVTASAHRRFEILASGREISVVYFNINYSKHILISNLMSLRIFYPFVESSAMSTSEFLPAFNITNLHCKEDFFEHNFTCLPRCDHWDGRPQSLFVVITDIMRAVFTIFKLLLSVLLIVVFVIRRKTL